MAVGIFICKFHSPRAGGAAGGTLAIRTRNQQAYPVHFAFASSNDVIAVKNSDDDEARDDVALALDDNGVAVQPNSFISDAFVAQKVLARQAEYCSSQSPEMHRATLMQLRALQV